MKACFLSILLLMILGTLSAQNYKDFMRAADESFAQQDYYRSALLYKKALSKTKTEEAAYKYAESLRLSFEYEEAEKIYSRLLRDSVKRYPDIQYHLAEMQKILGQYLKAQKNFRDYYEHNKESNSFNSVKARQEIISCEKAFEMKFNPVGVQIEKLPEILNSYYSDFAATPYTEDSILYSSMLPDTSNQIFTVKIYKHKMPDSSSVLDENKVVFLEDTMAHISNPFYYSKTNELFFTKTAYSHNKSISKIFVLKNGDKIENAEELPESINIQSCNNTQPSIAEFNGEKYLLFTSDRKGGEGLFDIYLSKIDSGYSDPVQIGIDQLDIDSDLSYFFEQHSKINTAGNEITPFFFPQDSCLYFSSDWHYGCGGYDIFRVKTDFKSWGEVENLGMPINTSYNDLYYRINQKGEFAFITSNRPGSLTIKNEGCCNDMYYYHMPGYVDEEEIEQNKINLFAKEIKLLVPLTLYFHNDEPNPRTTDTITNLSYETTILSYMQRLEEYEKEYSRGLKKDARNEAVNEINDFFKYEVEKGYNKLNDFFKLAKELLEKGQIVEVTLKGYASPLHNPEYNRNLAKRRISSLMNYFREYENGIFQQYEDSGQLIFKRLAFGEDMANKQVSDDLDDKRNSVYSPQAAKERKIEIIAVSITEE